MHANITASFRKEVMTICTIKDYFRHCRDYIKTYESLPDGVDVEKHVTAQLKDCKEKRKVNTLASLCSQKASHRRISDKSRAIKKKK